MPKKPKRKNTGDPEGEQHDRFTLSVRQGYLDWLKKAAFELNLDVSKLGRLAIEEYIKSHGHQLSDEVRKEFDALRRGHGPGQHGDLF